MQFIQSMYLIKLELKVQIERNVHNRHSGKFRREREKGGGEGRTIAPPLGRSTDPNPPTLGN